MPKMIDAGQRQSEFVAATWRVIHKEGVPAVTLRRVAAEAGCTTGALTHYFRNREALLVDALKHAHRAARARMKAVAEKHEGGIGRLEAILVEALPLDATRRGEWTTRLAVWAEARTSKTLRQVNAQRFAEWNAFLKKELSAIVPRAAIDDEALVLTALNDGMALRLLLHGQDRRRLAGTIRPAIRRHLQALQSRYA